MLRRRKLLASRNFVKTTPLAAIFFSGFSHALPATVTLLSNTVHPHLRRPAEPFPAGALRPYSTSTPPTRQHQSRTLWTDEEPARGNPVDNPLADPRPSVGLPRSWAAPLAWRAGPGPAPRVRVAFRRFAWRNHSQKASQSAG
ncbi:exported hypothetical protein [Nostocoides jenkinsii Ben 74]|uniref:Secreted protein n=1 Tax=Nostocoides jenkinsii Ben 74 TaxID=1193518 RepID=A0A077MBS2_9MICO|nr:exported hypothetical protein [Tetrasphaera jenkinsii Ben 74]